MPWFDPTTDDPIALYIKERVDAAVAGLVPGGASDLSRAFVPQQSTAPDHAVTSVWLDTSTSPAVLRSWSGTSWVAAGVSRDPDGSLLVG